MAASRRSCFGLLADHDFRFLFYAEVGSQLGAHVLRLALPLAAILALDATELEVGILAACMTAAMGVVGLPAGAIVDRLRRRRVMIVSDVARAAVLASVPLVWWLGDLTMVQLYAVALVVGVFTLFFDVAYQSYLPQLVKRDKLVEGNARLDAVYAVSSVAGRAAGGPLVQAITAPLALFTTVVGFVASALCLASIRKREPEPQRKPTVRLGAEIVEGLRFVLGHRLLRPIAASVATVNLFMAISAPVLLVFLARTLELSPTVIGLLLSFGGLGAVLGALLATRVTARLGHGRTIWLSLALTMPSTFLLPWVDADWRLILVGVQQVIFWAGILVNSIAQVSARQLVTPEHLLGRMNATKRFLVWGMTPIGALLGGALSSWLGVRAALWIFAVGSSLAFVWVAASPLATMREITAGDEPVSSRS